MGGLPQQYKDWFNFHKVNFPYMDSNIPSKPAYICWEELIQKWMKIVSKLSSTFGWLFNYYFPIEILKSSIIIQYWMILAITFWKIISCIQFWMILIITFWMIIIFDTFHPILDDSCHHFLDDYFVQQFLHSIGWSSSPLFG